MNNNDTPLIDICEDRHSGAPTSRDAFERIAGSLPERRRQVLSYVVSRGMDGCTVKEVAKQLGVGLNVVSGRLAELKHSGLALDSNRRRDGCAVIVAVDVAFGRV